MRANRGKEKKKEVPTTASLLDARDYTGAMTVIEFESTQTDSLVNAPKAQIVV